MGKHTNASIAGCDSRSEAPSHREDELRNVSVTDRTRPLYEYSAPVNRRKLTGELSTESERETCRQEVLNDRFFGRYFAHRRLLGKFKSFIDPRNTESYRSTGEGYRSTGEGSFYRDRTSRQFVRVRHSRKDDAARFSHIVPVGREDVCKDASGDGRNTESQSFSPRALYDDDNFIGSDVSPHVETEFVSGRGNYSSKDKSQPNCFEHTELLSVSQSTDHLDHSSCFHRDLNDHPDGLHLNTPLLYNGWTRFTDHGHLSSNFKSDRFELSYSDPGCSSCYGSLQKSTPAYLRKAASVILPTAQHTVDFTRDTLRKSNGLIAACNRALNENYGKFHETNLLTDDHGIIPANDGELKPQVMGVTLAVDAHRHRSIVEKRVEKRVDREVVVRQTTIGPEVSYSVVCLDSTHQPNTNGFGDGQGLVTIKMQPDEQGRFGFNVKGGADQGMPIIVSRVAPNTPADVCIPRLNEGDQVLYINGRDVSQHTHEQVVMFIRASREPHSGGELTLVVRPNVYVGDDPPEEPDLMYIPETHQITSSCADALDASIMLLQEALENGAAMAQFDHLYRKKPGLTMNAARISDNVPKNRYRDISPYDQTRVVLDAGITGDYINANYVNMEIPGSGIVNRYIAAQGPLPNTCIDFWQMVWEQQSSLVVMLTAKVERGRPKCHQYWPDLYETTDFGTLQITCVKEEETASFAFREFTLSHVETNEERQIVHMQYIAWPDHGVPDDSSDFLDYVLKVRQNRVGMVEPTIVHCSAGIGRTGVLITMETAMCLIEANQPVYPQSIVRQMRDQRAMLIQTASQYKFVCEAITRVYTDELVKPLEDYQR